jgi:outer membrane lipoprotein carrier protein
VSRPISRSVLYLIIGCSVATRYAWCEIHPDVKPLVSRFESRYRAAHTLQATFLERYLENGRTTRVEAGTAYFRRPGKMRWEYESPEKNLFIVDGKSAWFYVPADHTATRVPAKESSDWRTPLALLAGEMKVSRVCARVESAHDEKPETPDHAVLFCQLRGTDSPTHKQGSQESAPQTREGSETVFFEIVKDSGELVRVLIQEPGGVGVEFHFANWKTDPPVAEGLFQFTAPVGVAIVNGELPQEDALVNH